MGDILMNDQMRVRTGDTVGTIEVTDGVVTKTLWKVEAVRTTETKHNFDVQVWCPFKQEWVYVHEEIDIVIHPIGDMPNAQQFYEIYQKNKYGNWERK